MPVSGRRAGPMLRVSPSESSWVSGFGSVRALPRAERFWGLEPMSPWHFLCAKLAAERSAGPTLCVTMHWFNQLNGQRVIWKHICFGSFIRPDRQ